MIQHCCVQDCKHNRRTSSCTFKRFPTDAQKSKLWETLVKRAVSSRPGTSEWKRSPWDRICECHFDDDQYEKNRPDGVSKLRWDAVPHLFGKRAKPPQHRLLVDPSSKMKEDKDQGTSVIQGPSWNKEHLSKEDNPPQAETSTEGLSGGNTDEAQSDLISIEGRDIAEMDRQRVIVEEDEETSVADEENTSFMERESNNEECVEGEAMSELISKDEAAYVASSVIVAPGGQLAEDYGSTVSQDCYYTGERRVVYNTHNVIDQAFQPDQQGLDNPENVESGESSETVCEGQYTQADNSQNVVLNRNDYEDESSTSENMQITERDEHMPGQEGSGQQEVLDEVDEEEGLEQEEEYGEEIEVEIEDCSDGEMEQDDGGVTYIITEDMIVVEEPESPHKSKETGDGFSSENDQKICDEQGTASQRMKRFVIKVPTSKTGPAGVANTAEIEISEVKDDEMSDLTIEEVHDNTSNTVTEEIHDSTPSTATEEICDNTPSSASGDICDNTPSTEEICDNTPSTEEICDSTPSTATEEIHDNTCSTATDEIPDNTLGAAAEEVHGNTSEMTIEKVHDNTSEITFEKVHDNTSEITFEKVHDITSEMTKENVHENTSEMTIEEDHKKTCEEPVTTVNDVPAEEVSVEVTVDLSSELSVERNPKPVLDNVMEDPSPSSEIEDAVEKQMGVLHSEDETAQKTSVCYKLLEFSHSSFKSKEGPAQPSSVQVNVAQPHEITEDSLEKHPVMIESAKEILDTTLLDKVHSNKKDSTTKPVPNLVRARDIATQDQIMITPEDKPEVIASRSGRSNKLRLIDSKHTNHRSDKKERRKSSEMEIEIETKLIKVVAEDQKEDSSFVKPQNILPASSGVDDKTKSGSRNALKHKLKDLSTESVDLVPAKTASLSSNSTSVISCPVIVAPELPPEKNASKQKPREDKAASEEKNSKVIKGDAADKEKLTQTKASSFVKDSKVEEVSPKKVKTDSKAAKAGVISEKKAATGSKETRSDVKSVKKVISDNKERKEDTISVKKASDRSESKAEMGRTKKENADIKETKAAGAKDISPAKNVITNSKEPKTGAISPKKLITDSKDMKSGSPKKSTHASVDVVTRSSRSEKQATSKSASPNKSSQNSKTKPSVNPESPTKDRKGNLKEASSKKQSAPVASVGASKASEAKATLRSVRLRKQTSEPPSNEGAGVPESSLVTAKRERVKGNEAVLPSRHSERVCRATEKAIASGILSRRSRVASSDSTAKDNEKSPAAVPTRKGKRKGEPPPVSDSDESPSRRRRSMRNSDPEVGSGSSEQVHRSGRKAKAVKRKGSPINQPHAKQIKTDEEVSSVFIASIPKMCRLCGSENENLLNVLGPEGKSLHLAEKIHSILPIKIAEKEPLPTGVCHSCVVTLIACEKLVEKSSQIDKQLRLHFKCPLVKVPLLALQDQETCSALPAVKKQPATVPSNSQSKGRSFKHSKPSEVVTLPATEKHPEGSPASPQHDLLLLLEASEIVAVDPVAVKSTDSEDSPPVLEAEPPSSQLQPMNQEIPAQPPILVPQPAKPLPELMPIDDSSSPMKRFGNTYKSRVVKQGQVEKIEAGSELLIGECYEECQEEPQGESYEEPAVGESKLNEQPMEVGTSTITTEEFHIVDLEMNVEEVPPDAVEEDTVPSSPKSVVDSILVDWSGDEDDNGPEQRIKPIVSTNRIVAIASTSKTDIMSEVVSIADINGSAIIVQPVSASKAPCLFVDDEDVEDVSRSKSSKPISAIDAKCVKQESFWPEPTENNVASEKHPNDVPWKCSVCGKRGKSITKFLEHKKLHLNDRKLVSCSKCSESFSNTNLLKAHMKVHDGDDVDEETLEERLAKQGVTTRRRPINASDPRETVVDVDLTPDDAGLYHCSLCLNAFTNIEALCQHKLIHQQNKDAAVYRCTLCRRTFFQNKEYQDHIASHQSGLKKQVPGMFQCAHCDLKLSSQKEFVDHINTHTTPIPVSGGDGAGDVQDKEKLSCDICHKNFDTRGKLRSHRSTVHKATAYACHLCDKVCQKRITLIEHLRKHTGDNPFACPVCDKRFNRLANYKAHMMIHENARRYECPYCGKRFNRQSIQQRHIKTHTNEHPRKHRCRVCNLCFGLATEMFNHRKLHTRDEVERANWEDEKQRMALTSFPCKVCQLPFGTVEEVLAHMPDHTDDDRDIAVKLKNPRLECDICGKVLNSKRTFNNHRSSHIDGKPFVCKICQKGYATSTGLNYHMLSHTGERPFPCTFCNKGYKNSTDLKVHMRQHTGEFPYKCNLCNKAFRSASSLQKHGFVHTEERPHSCQFCGMSFKRESTKINHERIHTNDRRFKCKVCSRTFIQKGACDTHEKLHFRGTSPSIYVRATDSTSEVITAQSDVLASSSSTSTTEMPSVEKQDLFDDLEEDFDEDDDEDDEYIIYEDDSVEDADEEEMDVDSDSQHKDNVRDPLKSNTSGSQKSFGESEKSSNGVSMQGASITPVSVSVANDTVPSAGDTSVHITIL